MSIIVASSPLGPPLLDTKDASTVLVYDGADKLIYFLIVLPSGPHEGNFMTCDAKDPNFVKIALNAGLKLFK